MKKKWFILAGCSLAFSIFHANRQLVAILLPCIKEDLQLNYTSSTFLALSYDVGYLLTLILAGYLAIYISKKNAIILGVLIVAFTSIFSNYFSSYNQLILIRIIAGLGFSLYFTSGQSYIVDYFSKNELGKAFGIHNVGCATGQIYGTLLGGSMAVFLPWKSSLGVFGLYCLVGAAVIGLLFRVKGHEKDPVSSRVIRKIRLRPLIMDKGFWVSSLVQTVSFTCFIIITTFLPLILTGSKGMSMSLTTNLMSLLLLVTIGSYLAVGVLSDRHEPRLLVITLFWAAALFCLLLIITDNTILIVIELMLLGFFAVGNFSIAIKLLTGKGGIFSEPFSLGVFNTISLGGAMLFTSLAGKAADIFGVNTILCVAAIIYLVAGFWFKSSMKPSLFCSSQDINSRPC